MSDANVRVVPVTRAGESIADPAQPEKLVAGSGRAELWNAFSDSSGRFHVGHWRAEPGVRRVSYSEDELCVLLEGRARITDEAGASVEFGPGDAFVIPRGFTGTWETVEPLTKLYAILEPGA